MKTIILNASPRKQRNTAKLLHSAEDGAKKAGAETEYVDLYDLNFADCHSCLACKRVGALPYKCYWKDDLSPIIEKIFEADAVIIGSPIYLSDTTARFHALWEIVVFAALSYGTPHPFEGKVNVGGIFTMNATEKWWNEMLEARIAEQFGWFKRLNGEIKLLPIFDTLQVDEYSKYDMEMFDAEHKKQRHDAVFPKDLEKAFAMGKNLVSMGKNEIICQHSAKNNQCISKVSL